MSVTEKPNAERIQAWVPSILAEQLRAQADLERRSLSQTIRLAVEDRLQTALPIGEGATSRGGRLSSRSGARRDVDAGSEDR